MKLIRLTISDYQKYYASTPLQPVETLLTKLTQYLGTLTHCFWIFSTSIAYLKLQRQFTFQEMLKKRLIFWQKGASTIPATPLPA